MQNAEALLFIDHDKSEIFESEVAGNEPMRADDDVDAALAKKLQHFPLFSLRAKAAKHFDSHGVIEHPLAENFEVLLREHRRRCQDRDLFAVHHRFKRRANCDFGFSEADVAANETVHRARAFHVDLRLDDRSQLIGRFAKWKRMLELDLPSRVGSEDVAGLGLALSLQGQHFAGVIKDRGDRIFLGPCPFDVGQRTEQRRFFADADVTRNKIRLLERHIEFRFVRKLEREHFSLAYSCGDRASRDFCRRHVCPYCNTVAYRQLDQAQESPHTVLEMDN